MPRYIDADEFIKRVIQYPRQSTKSIGLALADTPTADVVERKKAYLVNPNPYGTCSECGFLMDIRDKFNFCPHCGADMRGGDDA